MRKLSQSMLEHLSNEITSLATCWKLKLKDNRVMGFTSHVNDLVVDNIIYQAKSGFNASAIESDVSLAVDNLDIEGVIDNICISCEDLMTGKYDYAAIEIFMVNYNDLTQGKLMLRTGWFGEITIKGNQFIAEIRGLSEQLAKTIGEPYSKECRAEFCDHRCKLDINQFTYVCEVTEDSKSDIIIDSNRVEPNGYFARGLITFTSGKNKGFKTEVKDNIGHNIFTFLPLPYSSKKGDHYNISIGCDKSFSMCVARFNNAINFRGEPHIPGTDIIHRVY